MDSTALDALERRASDNGYVITLHADYRARGAVPLVVGESVAARLVCTNSAPVYFFELATRTDRACGIEQPHAPVGGEHLLA